EPDGRVFRHPKVVLVPAAVSADAIPGTAFWHTDPAPVIARQPRDLVQIQADIGLPQGGQPPGKPFAPQGNLLLAAAQTQVAGVPLFSFSQHGKDRLTD